MVDERKIIGKLGHETDWLRGETMNKELHNPRPIRGCSLCALFDKTIMLPKRKERVKK